MQSNQWQNHLVWTAKCPDALTNYRWTIKNKTEINLFYVRGFFSIFSQKCPPMAQRAVCIEIMPPLFFVSVDVVLEVGGRSAYCISGKNKSITVERKEY